MTIDYSKYEGHTAGPWHIDGIRVQSNESGWIRVVAKAVRQQCRTDREAVANANLIADAPLLLKRCRELEAALRFCLNVVEKGIEVRMEDRWPTLRDVLPEAKSRARSALGMDEVTK